MPLPRLSLTPGVSHGPLDGAWWPRCDAMEVELPALIGTQGNGKGDPYSGERPDAVEPG
ncbi:DUF5994 family protein [Streptomyces sparsogenes]|uniref:DUF5994 family protein n=1 Tax=Streptomyces sparsogenes TaxID=67365 RepID=UPI0033C5C67C